jgi:hypothetical protein
MRITLYTLVSILSLATHALAQTKDPAAAEELYKNARTAVERNDYQKACPLFAESQRLDPGSGTLLNLANCEEQLGQLASALSHYQEVRDQLPASDKRLSFATTKLAALAPRVPKVTLRFRGALPEDLQIQRDSITLSRAALGIALPIDPGAHSYRVKSAGHVDKTYELVLKEKESRELTIEVGAVKNDAPETPTLAVPGPAAEQARASTPTPAKTERATENPISNGTNVALGVTFASLGVLAVGSGIVTGLLSLDDSNTYKRSCPTVDVCPADAKAARDRGKTLAIVSPVAFGVGALSLGAAVYFLLIAPKPSPKRSAWTLVPNISLAQPGVSLTAPF